MHLVHVLMTYTPHFKDIEVVRGRLLAQWAKNVILTFFHNVLQVSIHRKNIKVSENCIIGNFASLLCTSFNEMLPSL